jgi:hypothetical protein
VFRDALHIRFCSAGGALNFKRPKNFWSGHAGSAGRALLAASARAAAAHRTRLRSRAAG